MNKDSRSFGNFFTEWLKQHSAGHWGKKSADVNSGRAAYAIRMFGEVPLQKLTAMRIEQDLLTLLAKGGRKTAQHPEGRPLSAKMVNDIAALVAQALDKALKWKLIDRNPMTDVERPTAHKKEVEIPEPDELERLLDRLQTTRYYALAVFAAASGCRRGEILALRWPDIDPKTGIVCVSKSLSQTKNGLELKVTKGRKTRHVRVSRTTIEVLLEHKQRLDHEKSLHGPDYNPNDLVFPTPDGEYYVPDQVTARFSEFMREVGIPATLHSLRHLHASLMLSKHVPITVISKRLGHANSQITLDIYSHAMKNDEATAADLRDEATEEIVRRTRKPKQTEASAASDVIFCYPKGCKKTGND